MHSFMTHTTVQPLNLVDPAVPLLHLARAAPRPPNPNRRVPQPPRAQCHCVGEVHSSCPPRSGRYAHAHPPQPHSKRAGTKRNEHPRSFPSKTRGQGKRQTEIKNYYKQQLNRCGAGAKLDGEGGRCACELAVDHITGHPEIEHDWWHLFTRRGPMEPGLSLLKGFGPAQPI